jgi:hypothetical protein
VKAHVPPPVPAPVNPVNPGPNACSIATYLAHFIMIETLKNMHTALLAGQTVDEWIRGIVTDILAFAPILAFITSPFESQYHTALPQPLADLNDAATDGVFEPLLKCAIFQAIETVGYVDGSNFAAVASSIAAISYTHAWVPAMVANFWTQMGLPQWQTLQAEGSLTAGDCSACPGPWCYEFTGATINTPAWQRIPGDATPGDVFTIGGGHITSIPVAGGVSELHIAQLFTPNANITEIVVTWHADQDWGSASRRVETDVPGCALSGSHGDFVTTCARSGAGTNIMDILIDTIGSGAPVSYITSVLVRGTGVCPFGPQNCV